MDIVLYIGMSMYYNQHYIFSYYVKAKIIYYFYGIYAKRFKKHMLPMSKASRNQE